jgi:hypothetical protein
LRPFLSCRPEIRYHRGKIRQLLRESDIPGLYLSWTFRAPLAYPGLLFRRSWPSRGGGLLTVAFTRGAGLEDRGRLGLVRGRGSGRCPGRPRWRPGPRRAGAAGAVCPRGSAARRARRGAGCGSTGTGKAWQPTGGRPRRPRAGQRPLARSPARPVRAGPPAAGARRAAGRVPGAGTGDGQRKLADRLSGFANLSPVQTVI